MARNTQHLAPSNRWKKSRSKIYSGRSGTASLNRPVGGTEYGTYGVVGDAGTTRVRSGKSSQKEYINTGKDALGISQSRYDEIMGKRKKNKSKK